MSAKLEILSAILEKCMNASPESVTHHAQSMARTISKTFGHGLRVKEITHRLSRLLKISERQAKALFYAEWEIIPAFVYLRLTDAYHHHLKLAEQRAEHQAAVYRALNQTWNDLWDQDLHACGSSGSAGELNALSASQSHSNALATVSLPSPTVSSSA